MCANFETGEKPVQELCKCFGGQRAWRGGRKPLSGQFCSKSGLYRTIADTIEAGLGRAHNFNASLLQPAMPSPAKENSAEDA